MLRGSRQLVTRKSGVSPACYGEVTRKLATFRPSRHVKMHSVWRVANFLVTIVANLLRGSWRRRQQVREEVTGKLVPVEFELKGRSQVISRSENPQARSPDALFSSKKLTFFSRCLQNTGRRSQCRWLFHCQNTQNKLITNKAVRYDNIFIFCSHYYRSKSIGRAEPIPARSFDLARPGVAPPLQWHHQALCSLLN